MLYSLCQCRHLHFDFKEACRGPLARLAEDTHLVAEHPYFSSLRENRIR